MGKVIACQENRKETNTLEVEVMDSSFFVSISNSEQPDWKEAIRSLLHYFDYAFSRFRMHNELWLFNQAAEGAVVSVSPVLYDLLKTAESYRLKTGGCFSPYMLNQMEAHGYKQSFPFVTAPKEQGEALTEELGGEPLIFHSNGTITKKTKHNIDLGGIAKGYAVEAAARWLRIHARSRFGIVDGGGDIQAWSNGEKTWRIGVMDPFQEGREIGSFSFQNGSIATSNLIYRSWWQGEEKKHHLLDGRTGKPIEPVIVQSTVLAESCLDAEVGAKLCFMDGLEQAGDQLQKLGGRFQFVLVQPDGRLTTGGVGV
ncbi:Thiamin biosynthesis lipoprotein ApbE [Bacillus badius]|nr:Thiamin biosynthesis lipoprotein ApbE [Bacillus badius]